MRTTTIEQFGSNGFTIKSDGSGYYCKDLTTLVLKFIDDSYQSLPREGELVSLHDGIQARVNEARIEIEKRKQIEENSRR